MTPVVKNETGRDESMKMLIDLPMSRSTKPVTVSLACSGPSPVPTSGSAGSDLVRPHSRNIGEDDCHDAAS